MDNSRLDPRKQRKYLLTLKALYRKNRVESLSLEELREKVLETTEGQHLKDNQKMFKAKAVNVIGKEAFEKLEQIADKEVFEKQAA